MTPRSVPLPDPAQRTDADAHSVGAQGDAWTIGHSTHTLAEFLALLHAYRIETVADVRRFPGSRRQPQFGEQALGASLEAHGIAYHWFPGLGGRRRVDLLDPEGSAWRNVSFRAYAQHVRSEEFALDLASLLHVAKASRTAIMCSELLWWRCHRRLIADVMVLCGWQVLHILGATECSTHRLDAPAHLTPGGLSYTAEPAQDVHDCC